MKSAPSPAACPDRALPRSAWLQAAPAGGGGARGLALPAAKSPIDDATIMFTEHAKNAIVVARTLHAGFSQAWNLSPQDVYATPMAPNNVLYTSYLLRVAYERPFHEGLGAFLPSYWIYWEVGKALEQHGAPVSLYQRWIDTYASAGFAAVVQQILALVNQVAEDLTAADKQRLTQHFVMTSRFEYLSLGHGLSPAAMGGVK